MTFEVLGEGLRLFEGWTLRNLVNFRKLCRERFIACLDKHRFQSLGPSSIWVGCPLLRPTWLVEEAYLPTWLYELLIRNQNDLKLQKFTRPLNIHSSIRQEYITALLNHTTCCICMGVHIRNGSTFCGELEVRFARARDKVTCPLTYQVPRDLLLVGRH